MSKLLKICGGIIVVTSTIAFLPVVGAVGAIGAVVVGLEAAAAAATAGTGMVIAGHSLEGEKEQ